MLHAREVHNTTIGDEDLVRLLTRQQECEEAPAAVTRPVVPTPAVGHHGIVGLFDPAQEE